MNDLVEAANPFPTATVQPSGGAITEATIAREVADVQVRHMMAKKFPRDPRVAMDRVLNACSRPGIAEDAFYQYSRGGNDIEGPSIKLLEAVAREWGNFEAGVDIFTARQGESEVVAYAVDLETGRREQRRFTVKHWRDTKQGGYAIKDERDIYELCANMGARRKRACMEAVIPSDVLALAENQCRITLKTSVEITPEFIESILAAFTKFGVTKDQLEKHIQRRMDTLTPALAMRLKKIHTSLKDGMSEPKDWFDMAPPGAEGAAPAPATRTEQVKERLKKKDAVKPAPATEPAAAAPNEPGPPALDEAAELLKIDGAASAEVAGEILDACRGQSWYPQAVEAYNNRWRDTLGG